MKISGNIQSIGDELEAQANILDLFAIKTTPPTTTKKSR